VFVYREKSRGERTQPRGEPVLMVRESETCFPSLMCCFLLDRRSVFQVESCTLSWESLSCSRARMIVLKADSKSLVLTVFTSIGYSCIDHSYAFQF